MEVNNLLNINIDLIKEYEKNLDPRFPEQNKIPAKVLGFGEISTVLEIGENVEDKKFAYKRMPLFKNQNEIDDYEVLFNEYHEILREIGISAPNYSTLHFVENNRYIFYGIQEKVESNAVGNRVLNYLSEKEIHLLVIAILNSLKKVFEFNRKNSGKLEIGIDSQISNWALKSFNAEKPRITEDIELIYFDTNTPLVKKAGKEQLNPELFLRSAPSFLVWFIRKFFLKDVMERYYDFRLVIIDILANFYKEQRAEIIPSVLATVNKYIENELADFNINPITIKEVKSYYNEDAFIWRFYLSARKIDRLIHMLLHKDYPYILPSKIKR